MLLKYSGFSPLGRVRPAGGRQNEVVNVETKPGRAARVRVADANEPFFPACRKNGGLGRNAMRVVAMRFVKGRKLSNGRQPI